jgi:hypothetical protein
VRDAVAAEPLSSGLERARGRAAGGERERGRRRTRAKLSVRKVVLTLTSKSVEIGLSMAGAKQYHDTGFILVPVVGRTSSRGVLVALDGNAPWCS